MFRIHWSCVIIFQFETPHTHTHHNHHHPTTPPPPPPSPPPPGYRVHGCSHSLGHAAAGHSWDRNLSYHLGLPGSFLNWSGEPPTEKAGERWSRTSDVSGGLTRFGLSQLLVALGPWPCDARPRTKVHQIKNQRISKVHHSGPESPRNFFRILRESH